MSVALRSHAHISFIRRRAVAAVLIAGMTAASCERLGDSAPAPADDSAFLWIGGDVNLGPGRTDVLAPLRPALAGGVGFVNLEGPVVRGARQDLDLGNRARALPILRRAGVRAVGIANNHARDDGPQGIERTWRALHDAGIQAANGAAAAVVRVRGRRIVITAHDLTTGAPDSLSHDLRAARGLGDHLVATFHVTGPPSYLPSPELRDAVAIALAAGADVVAAHGSHSIGALERRGPSLVAWGLGNLAFSCDCTDERDGLVLVLAPGGADGKLGAEIVPVRAGLRGQPARLAPDAGAVLDLVEALGTRGLRRVTDRARL